jgi:hypothetical protein
VKAYSYDVRRFIAGPRFAIIKHMKANAVGKNYTEVELAYAAGFIDADGAIMACIEKHSEKKFGFRVRIVVKVSQKDKKVISWFQKTFGIGMIRMNRSCYEWLVRDQKDCVRILSVLIPYLKGKKQQAQSALAILETSIAVKEDLIRVANLADTLSRLNVRSKNRRTNFASMIQM